MSEQFDFVSIKKKANVHFNGTSISHILELKDGTKKTLGVILPSDDPLTFKTHLAERIEIISGQCSVIVGDDPEMQIYASGESFQIPANSQFKIQTSEVVDYVCHFE
ncbi:Pyrimidine/purine nucleoside phosphorylase [Acinetobacter proteolyticus]|uniref:Pyrimidine/purine nucleoside phosphorylase n=1 Tax=Acinetobacter proteolyticus TaxID=1776741 RepID=A0A653K5P1_9GAMM|nr:pyrimidine/purine nucleoside phosphorylase [Acinetobacter proteolyticus]VXA56074.1 Pyrimidine/purine nucleoside phosphorylase [Acinetobacter proteolyticus]